MTQLLVSVCNRAEACTALQGGAQILDLKEPRGGALGAVEPSTFECVAKFLLQMDGPTPGTAVPWSVAMGELLAIRETHPLMDAMQRSPPDYAKVGLAGCRDRPNWISQWWQWRDQLPPTTEPVVVAYADPESRAPTVEQTLDWACEHHLPLALIDTGTKLHGGLLDHLPLPRLKRVFATFGNRLQIAVAGSLSTPTIAQLGAIHPEIIAVRTAACDQGRLGNICSRRVATLRRLIDARTARPHDAPPA